MDHLESLIDRYPVLEPCKEDVRAGFETLRLAFEGGHKLLACGNGGSAADAMHIVGELMKGFCRGRSVCEQERLCLYATPEEARYISDHLQGALPAIALGGETALVSAVLNDVGGDMVYAQQVYGYGRRGDVLLALSTSGNAANVNRAAQVAKAVGMKVLGLTGRDGGKLKGLCDVCVTVPQNRTYRVQELHLPVYHTLCLMLEDAFFGGEQDD